jgi:hypothetical protein
MLASEFFDIIEEPTEKGGVRVLYRPKTSVSILRLRASFAIMSISVEKYPLNSVE